MRSLLASTVVGVLLVTGSALTVPAADAAPAVTVKVAAPLPAGKVAVKKIATKTAPYAGKATVTPQVTASGRVSVKTRTLTVKQGSKTLAKNVKSAKLKAGTYRVTSRVTFRTYHLTSGTTTKVWSATKAKSLTQTLVVKQGKRPSSTRPISAWNCPSWAPIKGNASSRIYHVPGGRWYSRTKPEICFTTRAAAMAHGYRPSKNG